jgi:3-hydroxymyristoyl/3-hydroxydecanoyl-(acyl carrier protein) dehydratase
MDAVHNASLRIEPDHPALPGHFPGAPVVPGVVLLDHVLELAEAWLGAPIAVATLAQAKFVAPLLPAQTAAVALERRGTELKFRIERDGSLLAQGSFTLEAATGAGG